MMHEEKAKRRERMLGMRADGATYREIGEAFGLSRQRVQQIIAQRPGGDDRRRFSDAEIAAAVAEYEAGASVAVVARLLRVCTKTARKALLGTGAEMPSARRSRRASERREQMLAMRASGATYREIGEAFGLGRTAAQKVLREAGAEMRRRWANNRREQMLAMRASGATYREIGEAFGLGRATPCKIIRAAAEQGGFVPLPQTEGV